MKKYTVFTIFYCSREWKTLHHKLYTKSWLLCANLSKQIAKLKNSNRPRTWGHRCSCSHYRIMMQQHAFQKLSKGIQTHQSFINSKDWLDLVIAKAQHIVEFYVKCLVKNEKLHTLPWLVIGSRNMSWIERIRVWIYVITMVWNH